jgi:KipI family sensor histidine kinase inhibitor
MDAVPSVEPFGDRALLVTLGNVIDPVLNARVHQLAATLNERRAEGLGASVPAYASLLVPFSPAVIDVERATELVREVLGGVVEAPGRAEDSGPFVEIPVRYGGDDGPDLAEVAERVGKSEAEVIALHCGTIYRVYMLGFSPGFGYLGALPAELAVPRRAEPRVRVPAGSVAIAERQTAVYPSATAGGWHLIGLTELPMWDPAADPPSRLAPGQRVRFVPA